MAGLHGTKTICDHINKGYNTFIKLVNEYGFPATKIGGEWISDTDMIEDWRKETIKNKIKIPVND